jgi:hypothetical protein
MGIISDPPGALTIPPGALTNTSRDSGRKISRFEPSSILHQYFQRLQNHVPAGTLGLSGQVSEKSQIDYSWSL